MPPLQIRVPRTQPQKRCHKANTYRPAGNSRHLPRGVHGGVKTPPYRATGNGQSTGNPAQGTPLPGGIYASPTNRGTAYANQKRYHMATARGPHACGPYEPAGNVRRMGKAGVYRVPSTAGSRPRPTERGKLATNREPRVARTPAGRHICLPYKSGHRVRKPKTLP